MMKNPSPKSTLLVGLIAIFLIGGVAGGLVGARMGSDAIRKRSKIENISSNIMAMLTDELALRPEQVDTFEPLVAQACEDLRAVHRHGAQEVEQIIRRYHDKLAATALDPAQLTKLKELEAKRRSQFNEADLEEPKAPF